MRAVDDTFAKVLDSLVAYNFQTSQNWRNLDTSAWWHPAQNTDYSLRDLSTLDPLFDRSQLSYDYQRILSGKTETEAWPTTGEAMAVKAQLEWLMLQERAFRTRHCSQVRQFLHSAVRRASHADPAGVLLGGLRQWVENHASLVSGER
jgi:hypothetical protein